MTQQAFIIRGRIHVHGEGVHGLTVDAADRDLLFYEQMGSVLTNRNGEFSLTFEQSGLERLFDAAPEVVLTIRDALGTKLKIIEEGAVCRAGERFEADVELDPKDVAAHRKLNRSLSASGGLPPASRLELIGAAWNELARSRGDSRTFSNNFAFCPGPPMMRFPDLVDVALQVIDGRVDAVARFRDMLTTMAADSALDAEGERRLEEIGRSDTDSNDYWQARLEELQRARLRIPAGGDSFIPETGFIAVALAAAMLGGGDAKAMHRNLGIIHGQICGLGRLGPVVSAAQRVRLGEPGALVGFERAWTDFSDMWGPDDGPPVPRPGGEPQPGPAPRPWPDPWPPTPGGFPRDPGLIDKWICTLEIVRALRRISGLLGGGGYLITSVSDVHACPGDTITITGSGFGASAGEVVFYTSSGSGTVTPISWTDTSITVTVPANATCGPLTLRIYQMTVEVCGHFVDIYKTSFVRFQFLGGATRVSMLRFGGVRTPNCATPGTTARIDWATCNADAVRVVVADGDGSEIARIDPAPGSGSHSFPVPNVSTRGELRATAVVSGPCGDDTRTIDITIETPYALSIDGMEVTQAIQFYKAARHMTDAADRGPDNSLRLVTNKTAWVRVYLRSGGNAAFEAGQLTGVTGTLNVERRVGGIWSTVATLTPQNGPVTAQASFVSYNAERGNINNTLNFVVPAALMTGLLRFRADVSSPDACDRQAASSQVQVDVNLTQTLNAAFITIGYNGPNAARTAPLNLPAPNLAACQAETAWAMTAFPLSATPNVRIAGNFVTNTPIDDARSSPGACSPNWGPLLTTVANLVAADAALTPGVQWVYYGIIANGIPVNVPGCNGGATGGVAGQPATYAHEIAHQFGLPHAPCGNVGVPNANYPIYEPYDTPADPAGTTNFTMASIGEYGLNTATGQIFAPATSEDIMSYCGPRWVSVFTHNFLVNRPILVPSVIATGAAAGDTLPVETHDNPFNAADEAVRPRIYVLGSVDARGALEVASVARIETPYLVRDGQQRTLRLQLLGDDGQVVADDSLFAFPAQGEMGCCGECADDDTGFAFAAMVNDLEPGSALRILDPKSDEVLWQRDRPQKATKLKKVSARIRANTLKIAWKCTAADAGEVDTWVRWSANGGKTWGALRAGLRAESAELSIAHLPAGRLKFQILAQDGYACTAAETDELEHAPQAPSVAILTPTSGKMRHQGAQIQLRGCAAGDGVEALSERDYRWLIDGEEVGEGSDIWVTTPQPGERDIELQVRSPTGVGSARITVEF